MLFLKVTMVREKGNAGRTSGHDIIKHFTRGDSMNKTFFSSILCACVLAAGCATLTPLQKFEQDVKYRQAFVAGKPDLPVEVKDAILKGSFARGTDKSVIRDLFGEPGNRFVSESGMAELWFYEGSAFGFDKNGKLLKLSRDDEPKDATRVETEKKQ